MTVEEIIGQTRLLIQTKQAEFKKKSSSDMATETNPPESVGEMKSVDESAKAMTPKEEGDEDRNVDESANDSTAGAGHPDVGREQAMDADESVLDPTKKPAISADANAKTAADLANDLMGAIRAYQTVKKADAPKVEAKKAEAPKVEAKKEASEDVEFELTTDVLAKLAALMVATDEGKELARGVMAKQAGAEAAKELMDFVAQKQAEAAEYRQGQLVAEQLLAKLAEDYATKQANAQYVKLGQDMADAAMDPAMLEAMMAQGAPAAEEMPAEAMPAEEVAPVEVPAEEAAPEGEITVEDLGEAIDQLVAADVIAPEEAGEILDYLVSAEGGEAGPAEALPATEDAAMVEEAPPAEESVPEEEAKEAQAKKITKLAYVLAMHIGAAKVAASKQTPTKKK